MVNYYFEIISFLRSFYASIECSGTQTLIFSVTSDLQLLVEVIKFIAFFLYKYNCYVRSFHHQFAHDHISADEGLIKDQKGGKVSPNMYISKCKYTYRE